MTAPTPKTHKRSLVLAGGGVRLAYHAGVLVALEEAGIHFDHVDGTSGGIFGTAMLGSGISPTEAATRWRKLKLRGFMRLLPLKDYLSQHNMPALGGSKGIRNQVFPALGIDVEAIRGNTDIETTFNVCNFSTKTLETIEGSRITMDHLIAGMSLPIFSPAVLIDGSWYSDGIWIKDANLTETVRRGAREIWLVWCIGNTPEYLNGVFNQYVHMIEISANGGVFQELEWIRDQHRNNGPDGGQPPRLFIIKPEYPLPLDPDFFLGKIDADTLVNMGYARTKEYLQNPVPFDFKDIPSATVMKSPGITLHFRQQFSGTLPLETGDSRWLFRLGIFIRKVAGTLSFELCASVDTGSGTLVSGYDNRFKIMGNGRTECSFKFIRSGAVCEARLDIRWHSLCDFLLGLDAKRTKATILCGNVEIATGWCYQPAANRLGNLWHMNINGSEGALRKLRERGRMLRVLFP